MGTPKTRGSQRSDLPVQIRSQDQARSQGPQIIQVSECTYSLMQAPNEWSSSLLSLEGPHQAQIDGCCIPEHAFQSHGTLMTPPPGAEEKRAKHPGQKMAPSPGLGSPTHSSNNNNNNNKGWYLLTTPLCAKCFVIGLSVSPENHPVILLPHLSNQGDPLKI